MESHCNVDVIVRVAVVIVTNRQGYCREGRCMKGIGVRTIYENESRGIELESKVINLKREQESYHRTQMQKEMVIQQLKERGCRITKQRLLLLDIILEEDCSCCKEIYYRATKVDQGIGAATVYRMINILEEIGAISRKNMYKIACGKECQCY